MNTETYLNSPRTTPVIPPAKPIHWTPIVVAAIAAGTIISVTDIIRKPVSRPTPTPTIQTVSNVPSPTPAATPEPRPQPTPEPLRPAPVPLAPVVRRGEIVGLPVNTAWGLTMPCDGQKITVVYRGRVPSFGDLPRNPALNDMYSVTESGHSWVWYQLANFRAPAWVDP